MKFAQASFWVILGLQVGISALSGLKASAASVTEAKSSTRAKRSKPAASPWFYWARHVGIAEKNRREALDQLKKIPHLNDTLIQALDSSHRALALDVISALHLDSLMPQLLAEVPKDSDGFLTLTINSLLDEKNAKEVNAFYVEQLAKTNQAKLSAGSILAMLEPLGRLGVVLPTEDLPPLFEHEYPEVQSAALYYVRAMALQHRKFNYTHLIGEALKRPSYQVRLQAVILVDELLEFTKFASTFNWKDVQAWCEAEQNPRVKTHCLALLSKQADS